MRVVVLSVLLWLASLLSLTAQPFPALYDVAGVTAGDVLNVRSQPNAAAGKLGALSFNQRDIEVVAQDPDGKWGLINLGENAGWVALRYLRRHETGHAILADRFWCFGTEPFWSLDVTEGKMVAFSTPEGQVSEMPSGTLTPGVNYIDRFLLDMGENTAVLRREICSDGMSDRSFGIAIDLFGPLSGGNLLSGCCSIAPR
ncbi:peptide-binding protein [Sedimentitalea sp. HM32M-2]|uniref:peptide-binding protein n=1 Tax=Sedimentitalea sp. HM32M-2 TaxID=3351566 RepID=UPI00362E19A6